MSLVFGLIVTTQLVPAAAVGPGIDSQANQLRAMRALAAQVKIETVTTAAPQRFERLPEPVYRFVDPARRFSDGTMWAWGTTGRPVALLTLALGKQPSPEGKPRWVGELTSLAPGPIVATTPVAATWQPSTAGVVMQKLPGAPAPAADAPARLRQMKDLARQVKAYEYFQPKDQPERERYELRVLPQPVHRYADPGAGLTDGGLFIISYGVNPEIALLLEAGRQEKTEPVWMAGLARIAAAEVHVEYKGEAIWSHAARKPQGPRDDYWIFLKPLEPE